MRINTWSIWHMYAGYFRESFPDLEAVSEALVAESVAVYAYAPSDMAHWRERDSVAAKHLPIAHRGVPGRATIELLGADDDFTNQCAYEASVMSVAERQVINDSMLEASPCVRAFLGLCELRATTGVVRLYPQLKIYGNGVFVVEFRLLSPDEGTEFEDLIERHVNLLTVEAESIWMAPGLIRAAESAITHAHTQHLGRPQTGETQVVDRGGLSFLLAPLTNAKSLLPVALGDLGVVLQYTMAALEWAANRHPQRWRRGPGNQLGDYWVGHPVVYFIDYENQPDTLLDSSPVEGMAAAVLSRSVNPPSPLIGGPLEDLRGLGDFSMFLNDTVTAYFFARSELVSEHPSPEANWGHLFWEKQALAEAMQYQRLSHQRLVLLSASSGSSLAECLQQRAELMRVEAWLRPSRFGELNAILSKAQEYFGLAGMRERVRDNIETARQVCQDRRSYRLSTLALTVTIVLGLASAPAIADAFSIPILDDVGWLKTPLQPMTAVVVYLATFVLALSVAYAAASLVGHAVRGKARG